MLDIWPWKGVQSSPAPKDGCYEATHHEVGSLRKFQSSPAPKDGCYARSAPATITHLKSFQSSPAPKDRWYLLQASRPPITSKFQSSPAPKDGCYYTHQATANEIPEVSILT